MSPFFTSLIDARLRSTGLQTFESVIFITVSFGIIIQEIKSILLQVFVTYTPILVRMMDLLASLIVWYNGIILNFWIPSMLEFIVHILQ
jgi:hypothetical protein